MKGRNKQDDRDVRKGTWVKRRTREKKITGIKR
jgi:hypothetical protein